MIFLIDLVDVYLMFILMLTIFLKFLEEIRVRPDAGGLSPDKAGNNEQKPALVEHMVQPVAQPDTSSWGNEDSCFAEAHSKAERAIIEVEQYKLTLAQPKGNTVFDNEFCSVDLKDDDKFFHITCHFEPGLVAKILRGEFFELDKLFIRPK